MGDDHRRGTERLPLLVFRTAVYEADKALISVISY